MQIISWSEAKARGLKRYYTAKPCKNGHIAPRYVASFICVECQLAINPKKKAEYNRRWRAANRVQRRKALAIWRRENPEKRRTHDRVQRTKHAVKRKVQGRRWQIANPEKIKKYNSKRRAFKANAIGSFTEVDIARILKLQNKRCAYCRDPLDKKYEVDHIIPLSRGGTNYPKNLQLLCRFKCNQSKRDKDPIDFARSQGFLI